MAESAGLLCDADLVPISYADGQAIRMRDESGWTVSQGPLQFHGTTFAGRALLERRMVHVVGPVSEWGSAYPGALRFGFTAQHPGLAALAVPLLRESEPVGSILLLRGEARPYTDTQMALLQTFADQAVIALENARLFREIQQKGRELEERNRELTELLEQQTATAEVLGIISRSPVDLEPVVFEIVERAVHLLGADLSGWLTLLDNETTSRRLGVTMHSRPYLSHPPPGLVLRSPTRSIELGGGRREIEGLSTPGGKAIRTGIPVQVWGTGQDIHAAFPDASGFSEYETQSRLSVPLLRGAEVIGVLTVFRSVGEPFSDKQIAAMQTFADQAVIAIENARLFEEIQQKSRELEEINRQLEAASRAKSEFLSRMSHELRTPLNAVIGFGEIMEMDPATTARQHERVRYILQGGRHLLGLINEVLDITRIESGHLSLSPEPVLLDGVVQEVIDLERPLAADAKVELGLDEPSAFRVAVLADRQRLRQIILNLVANAIKYNRPGGRVTLSVSSGQRGMSNEEEAGSSLLVAHPSLLRLTVRDTGLGIPADQIGRLFEPFERLSAETSGVEGTGLGLAIARGLAEAMGGTIGVESVVGEGSSFWVELPAVLSAPALPEAEELARSGAEDAAQATATVLYIEDNQPNVDLVQHVLQFRPGMTLLTAPDGATGLRIARRYLPNLILLDLNLPDLQGDEVLARLRADEHTSAIPVVMVSADATQGQIDRLLAAGARAYLTKPLDVKRLLALVDEIATSNEQRRTRDERRNARGERRGKSDGRRSAV
ncbi:MAG: ATP-binding protein [Dehalococcoidia bacterium]